MLFKVRGVEVGSVALDVIDGFLSSRVQRVVVDRVSIVVLGCFPVYLQVVFLVICCYCCTRVICQ